MKHREIRSWLMDMDGVLVREEHPIPRAAEFLATLRERTLPFLVLFQIGFLYTGLVSIVQQYAGEPDVAELPVSSRIQ